VLRIWRLALGGHAAHRYGEALVADFVAIGLGVVAVLGAALSLRASVRVLRRAGSRVDAIFADELRDRPR
jgi:hypothetical protein